jgi:hypothetical protein
MAKFPYKTALIDGAFFWNARKHTGRQLGEPPLHVQTLTVKWWMSTPATLRFGPAQNLQRPQ